ncbi:MULTISPECIES: radical SAM/SPASM domain-containing protein [unclassified Clostridium]|uniref:radical SAM/SPASM domain-containing protein n=1 Tax=unclassified Clostridium TaxID=2614128 RepID=UPI00029799CD|nr:MULTISPECIES: radical SAM/SPASM domain-containing protein [unclassified Clostridium]EKQ51116.1 MAG: radical SAM superfamily enzyme [Clostridium sp. Maddingley MBC34-26]
METLYIELTHRCNLKCSFCYRHKVEEKNDMELATCKKILNEAKHIGIRNVSFNGYGENILHKDFVKALRYACDSFDSVRFNTNGLALSDKLCDEILETKLNNITFSVTGYNFDVYNDFQGSGLNNKLIREKVYNNVLNFIRKRNENENNVKVIMQYILTDKLKGDIVNYIDFWKDKVDDIYVTHLNSIFGENSTINKREWAPSRHKCFKIGNEFLIHANGDVSLCCGDCFKGAVIGNINEISMFELISNDKFKHLKELNDKLEFDGMPIVCQKCDEVYENLFFDSSCQYSKLKKYISIAKELGNEKLALVGINDNMNNFVCAMKVFSNSDDFIIVDSFKEGFYEKKQIFKPIKEVLKNRKILIFADNKFKELQNVMHDMGLECVSHKQLMK